MTVSSNLSNISVAMHSQQKLQSLLLSVQSETEFQNHFLIKLGAYLTLVTLVKRTSHGCLNLELPCMNMMPTFMIFFCFKILPEVPLG